MLGRRHEGWTFSGPAWATTVMCCCCSSIQHAIQISHATVMRLCYRYWTLLYLHTASVVHHSHPRTHVPGMFFIGCFTYPVLSLQSTAVRFFKSTSQSRARQCRHVNMRRNNIHTLPSSTVPIKQGTGHLSLLKKRALRQRGWDSLGTKQLWSR